MEYGTLVRWMLTPIGTLESSWSLATGFPASEVVIMKQIFNPTSRFVLYLEGIQSRFMAHLWENFGGELLKRFGHEVHARDGITLNPELIGATSLGGKATQRPQLLL
jgi:hypothetical protein